MKEFLALMLRGAIFLSAFLSAGFVIWKMIEFFFPSADPKEIIMGLLDAVVVFFVVFVFGMWTAGWRKLFK